MVAVHTTRLGIIQWKSCSQVLPAGFWHALPRCSGGVCLCHMAHLFFYRWTTAPESGYCWDWILQEAQHQVGDRCWSRHLSHPWKEVQWLPERVVYFWAVCSRPSHTSWKTIHVNQGQGRKTNHRWAHKTVPTKRSRMKSSLWHYKCITTSIMDPFLVSPSPPQKMMIVLSAWFKCDYVVVWFILFSLTVQDASVHGPLSCCFYAMSS